MYENLICAVCNTKLTPKKTNFEYLGHNFFSDIPACPDCGRVFVSKELARGKIQEVEKKLEEK